MAGNRNSGRRKLPVSVHIARGTYRRDRHGELPAGPEPSTTGNMFVPEWLSPAALELWKLLEPMLGPALRPSDSPSFSLLCEKWSLLGAAIVAAREDPTDKPTRAAVVSYGQLFTKLAAEFGLDPASREKLKLMPLPSPPKIRSYRRPS